MLKEVPVRSDRFGKAGKQRNKPICKGCIESFCRVENDQDKSSQSQENLMSIEKRQLPWSNDLAFSNRFIGLFYQQIQLPQSIEISK